MKHNRHISAFLATLLLTAAWGARAATVSYIMDQSNRLPDNVHYLTVTLSDDVDGQLDFWVDAAPSLTGIATDNFGIQSFSFSLAGDKRHDNAVPDALRQDGDHRQDADHRADGEHRQDGDHREDDGRYCKLDSMLTADRFILPDGWKVLSGDGNRDGAHDGFDIRLLGNDDSRQDPLHFSILGLGLDDIQGTFGAMVAGFEFRVGECGDGEGEHRDCEVINRAEFQGGTPVVVPLPATLWLLGSGLLGLAGVTARRRRG